MPSVRFVERFDLTTPRFALAIIDLAQIQNRTLHHTTTRTASAFDNAPSTGAPCRPSVAVRIASTWPAILCTNQKPKRGEVFTTRVSASSPLEEIQLSPTH